MITIYLDKSCKALNASQGLNLSEDCSALWFCVEKGSDLSRFLEFMVSTFDSFVGFFWLAFSGGAGSPKMLELKRSFGQWSVPKKDVVSKHDWVDENRKKLYSDIAQINASNIGALSALLNRNMFGIDSAIFFLPSGTSLSSVDDIAKPLVDLLEKRNAMDAIDERLLNQGLIESFVSKILSLDGIATLTLRDSNMSTMIVAVGNQFSLSRIAKLMEGDSAEREWMRIVDEVEFNQLLRAGVSVSAFS